MSWLQKTLTLLKKPLNFRKPQLRSSRISRDRTSGCSETKFLDVPENPLESVILKNGMRLISESKDSCITTVGCFLPAGSVHETPEERGASLLMEHLIFKRTKCRNQEETSQLLEQIGAKLGAVAMRDMFIFYGTVPSCDVEPIVGLLADVILNGIICDEDLSAARCMILRELSEMESDNERVVMDYLPTIAYQGTELGRSVYPNTCTLENLGVKNVESFRNRLFKPSLMTMVATGGTSFADFQNLAKEFFLGSQQNQCPDEEDCTTKELDCTPFYRFTGSEIRLRDDDEALGHVAIAIEGPGHACCEDHCILTVAKEIVGSWDVTHGGGRDNAPYLASCAFNTNMCHVYKSFNLGWAQTSLWGCYFVCEKMELEDMMWMVQNEWMRLCSTIKSKELARAVNQCKTRELVRINDSVDRFFDISTSVCRRGCYETFNERIARYERVTTESLKAVTYRYIYDQCPAVAAVGPVENLPDYNRIRSYMYRIRN